LAQEWDDIWVITYIPCIEASTQGFNTYIKNNASSMGYNVLDIYDYFADPEDPDQGLEEYFYSDYVHLNATGQDLLAGLIFSGIISGYFYT
jgi:lysophospholipase L1-like esterase